MKKALISLIFIIIFIFCSCTASNISDTSIVSKLTYYTAGTDSDICELIKKYNRYCNKNYDESYQIEIIEFDSESDMNYKMSTEIMAGGGPDILSTDQTLPFEKLIQNGAFLDINTLINNDKGEDKLDINSYNSVIMNAGVYDGKRFIIPLSYGLDVLVSTQERLEKFGVFCDNAATLTYSNISDKFFSFFNSETDYSFVSNDCGTLLWFDHPMQLFSRFINSYVDFENKVTYFDSDEFKNNLDTMYEMVKVSSADNSGALFDDLYINRSLPLITGNYAYYTSIDETPIMCRGLVIDNDDYSAFVQLGFAINSNTKLKEQAYAFTKYVLSDSVQMNLCGAAGNSYSANIAFPVNKRAYERSKIISSKRTDDNDEVIGIDNDFVGTYINIAENVNRCTLYMNVSHSFYNSEVIGDIVNKYLNGDISKDKFIRQLTAATEIYLTE